MVKFVMKYGIAKFLAILFREDIRNFKLLSFGHCLKVALTPPPTVKQQVDITLEKKKTIKDIEFTEKVLKGRHFRA